MNWTQMWLVWGLSLFIFLFFYLRIFERRYSILKTLLINYGIHGVSNAIKMWFTIYHGPESYPQYSLIIILIHLLFLVICFKDSISKKIIMGMAIVIAVGIAEIITLYLCGFFWDITPEKVLSEDVYLYVMIMEHMLIALFLLLMEKVWKKGVMKQRANYDWCFVIMLLGQLLFFIPNVMKVMGKGGGLSSIGMIGLLVGLVFITILPTVIKETEKRKAIELEMKRLKQYYELEKVHYELLIKEQKDMAKIRHDFNNQLMVVYSLANANKVHEAMTLLSELEKQIDEERLF